MRRVTIREDFDGWREAARRLLAEDIPPAALVWAGEGAEQLSLVGGRPSSPDAPGGGTTEGSGTTRGGGGRVPRSFLKLAELAACHSDPERWALLYRLLWRLNHGEPKLLHIRVDPDVHRLVRLASAIRRDEHKMHAFVRFRRTEADGEPWYVAWFEPEHHIVERGANFFARRFAAMRWSILGPRRCAHWDLHQLRFSPGVDRSAAPPDDQLEELWRTYYSHIFNPARVKTRAMQGEMPHKYWRNLPEAELIPRLVREAPARVQRMIDEAAGKASERTPPPPGELPA